MITMTTVVLLSHSLIRSLTLRTLYKVAVYDGIVSGLNLFHHTNSTYLLKHIVPSKAGHLGTLYLRQIQVSCHGKMHIISFADRDSSVFEDKFLQ